jgi:hypothetical protein
MKKKKCKCSITEDGECEACKARASTAGVRFQELFSQFILSYQALEMQEKLQESSNAFGAVGSCDRCNKKYIDFAISKIVSGLKGNKDSRFGTAFAINFVKNVREQFSKRGVMHFPLSERALEEHSK